MHNNMRDHGIFRSSSRHQNIAYSVYAPPFGRPKAIVQISHGMCEYLGRYEEFAAFLTSQGFLVCGNDHLGHGKSVTAEEELGYFAHEGGWKYFSEDLYQLTSLMKQNYPGIPYFMLGHSMGSFIVRDYMTRYGKELDGVILTGTSGSNPLNDFAIILAKAIGALKGEKYRSKFIHQLSFGKYTQRYQDSKTKFDWLSRDEAIVSCYMEDKFCNFIFTAKGFEDLFCLLKDINSPKWAAKIPKELPVALLSGDMDPVGNYGEGVREVYQNLMDAGLKNLSMHLYPEARHEILNEINRQDVYRDISDWLHTVLLPRQEKALSL